ncbi:hypothetical protein EVJ20_09525 [Exiguobacterium sp. SH0S1]|uniref:hypothetical protein n=1 Tax=Exiguobacterium sp. SH0S1 TaxID=2510949 RepID=UPI00103B31C2|nr:hypothetical protein [Exiguobacterium sp. SH0S1]TCI76949.1 hypothetical protein EVJ20_09525 [Exiguobacterium sp. SH0S1]
MKKGLTILALSFLLVGCNATKEEVVTESKDSADSTKEVTVKTEADSSTDQASEKLTEEADATPADSAVPVENTFKLTELKGNDINQTLRKPADFTGKEFSFIAHVHNTQTSEDGIQTLTVRVRDSANEHTAIIDYNPISFSNERIVEGDIVAVNATFEKIVNSEFSEGDAPKFKALAKTRVIDYLSMLGVATYYEGLGISVDQLNINVEDGSSIDSIEEVISMPVHEDSQVLLEDAGSDTFSFLSTTSNDTKMYWIGEYDDEFRMEEYEFTTQLYVYFGKTQNEAKSFKFDNFERLYVDYWTE